MPRGNCLSNSTPQNRSHGFDVPNKNGHDNMSKLPQEPSVEKCPAGFGLRGLNCANTHEGFSKKIKESLTSTPPMPDTCF